MLFTGRNRVKYDYSRFGYTRGGGKTWHGGLDIEGIDDKTIHMPYYNGKSISGQVVTSRIVTDHSNLTWEWGYYVCVKLDANQTPDVVNYLYFCHNSQNLVTVGQRVKSGEALAIMGNSGNAAQANPPFEHCHFEVRQTATSKGLDPTAYAGIPNAVGTYTDDQTSSGDTGGSSGNSAVEIKGIDVSRYQGTINWNKVKEAGIKFAMLRIVSSNNNGLYIDPTFEQNYVGAKAAGVAVGGYIYTYATNEDYQNQEILKAMEALKGKTLDYPLALDVEDKSLVSMGKSALTELVKRGLIIIEQKGFMSMLYTYTNYTNNLDMSSLSDYDLWIADYRGYNGYGKCQIWQYASDGKVDGISGNCDMNICYKEYAKQDSSDEDSKEEDTSTEKPSDEEGSTTTPTLQKLTIGPLSNEKAMTFWTMAQNLKVGYSAQQIIEIGPVSSGDAMKFWSKTKELNVPYSSKYVEEG